MNHDADSIQSGLETIDVSQIDVDPLVIMKVPPEVALKLRILPIFFHEGILTCAVDQFDLEVMDQAMSLLSVDGIEFRLARPDHLMLKIRYYYAD